MKEPSAQSTVAVRYGFNHKIKTDCAYQNKAIPVFLGSTAALCVLSLWYLDVDWIKLAGRVPDMGSIFYRLAQFDFKYMDLIAAAMWETLSITVLSTLYSVILGLFFGMFAAENIFRMRWMSVLVQSWFTFLRAVPTPVLPVCACIQRRFLPVLSHRALKASRRKLSKRWRQPALAE